MLLPQVGECWAKIVNRLGIDAAKKICCFLTMVVAMGMYCTVVDRVVVILLITVL